MFVFEVICGSALAFAFVVGAVVRDRPRTPDLGCRCAGCGGPIVSHWDAIGCAGCGRPVHLGCLPHRHDGGRR